MKILSLVLASAGLMFAAGCSKPQASPPPASAANPPPPQAAPATEPAPQAAVAAPADRRGEVRTLLDQIDHELQECSAHKMGKVQKHADEILRLSTTLNDPLATVPSAMAIYPELQSEAEKFVEACRRGQHQDKHHHHDHMLSLVARIRSTL